MNKKILVGLVIAGMVFSMVNISISITHDWGEIKIRGVIVNIIDETSPTYWYVEVDEILINDPSNPVNLNEVIEVYWALDYEGQFDLNINIGDHVEAYGYFMDMIVWLEEHRHYLKKIDVPEENKEVLFQGTVISHEPPRECGYIPMKIRIDKIIKGKLTGCEVVNFGLPGGSYDPDLILPIENGDRLEVYGCHYSSSYDKCSVTLCGSKYYVKKISDDPCEGVTCPDDGYVGEKYCKNGDVYRKYRDYYCENGECKYREEERKIKDCDYGCENGGCKPKPTTPPPTTASPTTPPPTTTPPPDGLTLEEKKALAERYAPTLKYYFDFSEKQEQFFLVEAEYFIVASKDNTEENRYELLKHPQADWEDLGKKENALKWQEYYEEWNYRENPVYVHVTRDTYKGKEYTVIQYWFCYLFNYHGVWKDHEGDWEMIEVILKYDDTKENEFPAPYMIAYSQHLGGETHKWNDEIVEDERGHPIVYVGWGSHASYFDQGRGVDDRNNGIRIAYERLNLELLDDQGWLYKDYLWGRQEPLPGTDIGGSPQGPRYNSDREKWEYPCAWAEKHLEGSVEFGLGSPAHLLITNSKGQRIGYVGEEFVNEISNAYKLITEDHEFYHLPNDTYSVEIDAFEDGDIDFDIRINNNGEVTYISYKDMAVTNETKAYTDIDPSKEEYEIKVDRNRDGKIDETIEPDNIIKHSGETKTPVPTIPPASDNKVLFLGLIIAIIIASIVLIFSRGHLLGTTGTSEGKGFVEWDEKETGTSEDEGYISDWEEETSRTTEEGFVEWDEEETVSDEEEGFVGW